MQRRSAYFGALTGTFLTPVGSASVAVPLVSDITLPGFVYLFGASSGAGGQIATAGSGGTEDSLTDVVRVIEKLPAASLSYTVSSNSGNRAARTPDPIAYNLTGANSALQIRNRGVGGQTSGSGGTIASTIAAAASGFGASDFIVLHQGDNGITVPGSNNVELLAGGYAALRSSAAAQVAANNFVQVVNTQGGRGSAGSLAGEPPGGSWGLLKAASMRVQSDLTPGRVFSFHETLLDRSTGLNAGELTDLSQGMMPRTFAMNDGSHQIDKGYNLQSAAVMTPLIDAWAGGIPFPLKQIVEAVTPSTPAAGDVIGNVICYGTGGTFSLDPSNTQTDYAISASGQITRIGATPPSRDITWMAVRITKPGRAYVPSPGASPLEYKVQPLIGICERAASGVSRLVEFDGHCIMGVPDSKQTNGPIVTILMRLQHHFTGVDQQRVCGANLTSGWSVSLRTTGVVEIRFRNVGTAANAMSKDISGTQFSPANAPNGRWIAISIDMSSATPSLRKTDLVHWTDPASATTDLTVLSGTDQPANASTVNPVIDRATPWYIGAWTAAAAGTAFARMRIADFTVFNGYIDFTVLANRQQVSNADATPKAAWVSSGGVTAGVTPYFRLGGNAGDWRNCRTTGTGIPATPGASGQYIAFNNRERSAGVPGFLVTV